jgi:hypothetical protein
MDNKKEYAKFDERLVQELEQRTEFSCPECGIAIGELAGGVLLGIFGGPGGMAAGVALITAGSNAIFNPNVHAC